MKNPIMHSPTMNKPIQKYYKNYNYYDILSKITNFQLENTYFKNLLVFDRQMWPLKSGCRWRQGQS